MIGRWPLHPILFPLFPILSIFGASHGFGSPSELVGPLAIAAGVSATVWLGLAAATRDPRRSAQTTSVVAVVFYALGLAPILLKYVLDGMSGIWVKRQHQISTPLVSAVVVGLAAWLLVRIWRKGRDPRAADSFLNIVAGALVAVPLAQLISLEARDLRHGAYRPEPLLAPSAARGESRPDIYYVILDGYARADTLRDLFELDNTPFLDALKSRGFSVADRSTSNYCQTPLSLASSLNARYLEPEDGEPGDDREPMRQRIRGNAVGRTLRDLGYKTVAFDSGFDVSDMRRAVDVYMTLHERLTGFHAYLIELTPLRWFRAPLHLESPFEESRDRVEFALANLARVAADPRPTFTVAHLLSPHPPFLHRADGSPRENPGDNFAMVDGDNFDREYGGDLPYAEGYRDQVLYLNRRILEAIDAIQAASPEPPVIILQSDHGSGMRYNLNSVSETDLRERFGNLIAVGWPDHGAPPGFRDDLSAVNVFRVVLNGLFGEGPTQLPDRCYYSDFHEPYRYVEVTAEIRGPDTTDSPDRAPKLD